MPVFFPFRAFRPTRDKVARFSAKTSDFSNQEEVVNEMKIHPESYYYVTKQHLLSDKKKPVEYFFSLGAEFFRKKVEEGVLIRDFVPCYYVYRQTDPVRELSYTGIIGLADAHDLETGEIKKHELTKVVREEYLYKQAHYTEVLGEPVLLGYPHSQEVEDIIRSTMKEEPEYDFETIDKKRHEVWLINTSERMEEVCEIFQRMPAFYIADGHHRSASTIRNYHRNPDPVNRYFMVFLLDEQQMNISSFHRLVSGIDFNRSYIEKLREYFTVEELEPGQLYKPEAHGEFGLLTRDFSLKLKLVKEPRTHNPEAHLDVSVLENKLFKPIMDIHHPRTDHRLSYISSLDRFEHVMELLQNGQVDVVISNYPISFEEVKQVADANRTMPPKSTYIEPKLRGGMIIQKF